MEKPDLDSVCQTIVKEFNPLKIILFGSHAYGTPGEDSDIDLLVVMNFSDHPVYQAARIRERLDTSIPIDVIAFTPEYLQQRIAMDDSFYQKIVNQGKLIYETYNP